MCAIDIRVCIRHVTKGFLCSPLEEQLCKKDEALSAAQPSATAERDGLAQQLREAKEEVARLKAGSKEVEQPATDGVKVGKPPRTCLHAIVHIAPLCLQIEWVNQV
jgi:hypothetical protein